MVDEAITIKIPQRHIFLARAISAHLNRIWQTVFCNGRVLRPIEMDQDSLLLASASLRTLVFGNSPGDGILLKFFKEHNIDAKVHTVSTDLNLLFMSHFFPNDDHISSLLAQIAINPDSISTEGPMPLTGEFFFAIANPEVVQDQMKNLNLWMPTSSECPDYGLGISPTGPAGLVRYTRHSSKLDDWGNQRIGILKSTEIRKSNIIQFAANKLGGVHYDSSRIPSREDDRNQYKILSTVYDWDYQSIIHAALIATALISLELFTSSEVIMLRENLPKFLNDRQARLMAGMRLADDPHDFKKMMFMTENKLDIG